MDFMSAFEPYSEERNGELEKYLREHDGTVADNHFYGADYFIIIRDKGLIIPKHTCVRVSRTPIPDATYLVNPDFMLVSSGPGKYNMSAVGAEKGVYDPNVELNARHWSIHGLKQDELRK